MFPIEAFRNTLLKVTPVLERLGIPFHLTGGITTAAYVEPRMTQDVDIVVDPESLERELEGFLGAVRDLGFTFQDESVKTAVRKRGLFQLLDEEEILKLDVYPSELIAGELSRSVMAEVFEGVELPIASRLDATLSKLAWVSRGSHKNRSDVRNLVASMCREERDLLGCWALELGLEGLLAEVLGEGEGPTGGGAGASA